MIATSIHWSMVPLHQTISTQVYPSIVSFGGHQNQSDCVLNVYPFRGAPDFLPIILKIINKPIKMVAK